MAGDPLVEGNSNIEYSNEIDNGQRCEGPVTRVNGEDTQCLVRMQKGSKKVESSCDMPYGKYSGLTLNFKVKITSRKTSGL